MGGVCNVWVGVWCVCVCVMCGVMYSMCGWCVCVKFA